MSPPAAPSFDRRLLAPLVLGSLLNPVNSSIIAVSLVPIGRAFGAPPAQTAWLVSALYLATSIGQPVVGRLIDTSGPRRLFLAGALLTGLAGVIGALAPSLWVLVVARVILGFGTCAGYPAAMFLIRSESRRTGASSPAGVLTILAVSTQTVAVIGPALGGLLIGAGGWRTTLAINIPLAAATLAVGWRRLPAIAPGELSSSRRSLDLPGVALFAATLIVLLLFLLHPRVGDLWLLPISALGAAAFVRREHRQADPFIDLAVLVGNRPLVLTYLRTLLAQLVSYAFLYGFSQWLQDGRGLPASTAGLVTLPVFATAIVVSTTTGRNPQLRGKLLVGAATQVISCLVLLLLTRSSPLIVLLGVGALFGIPQGLNNLANQNALYAQVEPERTAASAGLLRTFGYIGAIAASAAAGALMPATASSTAMHHLAIFMGVCAALFLIVTLLDYSLQTLRVTETPRPA